MESLEQKILEYIDFSEDLPYNWSSFDLQNFSQEKELWDYQERAVKNGIKALWKYYEDLVDFQEGEQLKLNQKRKRLLFEEYKNHNLDKELSIELKDNKVKNLRLKKLLQDHYSFEKEHLQTNNRYIFSYENFINRAGFWMATGSGKTIVMIKMIEIIKKLIQRGEIPQNDILFLTYRDDLLNQFKEEVNEFNQRSNDVTIQLEELRDYPKVKRNRTLFREDEITVFYYRSDNLSDVQKDKIIDYKNYDNEGQWYLFLDEAHKGGKEESKRQHIYSILSRNGFLFNSSATFTDKRSRVTTAFDFKLGKYIKKGYGKKISIVKQEIEGFEEADEGFTNKKKQRIVLETLILISYIKKFYRKIKGHDDLKYHRPMLVTLANTVNIENADLKEFFRVIGQVGKGAIEDDLFQEAKNRLWDEFSQRPNYIFNDEEKVKIKKEELKSTTKEDILNLIFNSDAYGEIEIIRNQGNQKELAFKLRTSEEPFALIKIGSISNWIKWLEEELDSFSIEENLSEEGYFEKLDRESSKINLLMGSRSFYEGWDINRPNVMLYINIGQSKAAKKFILQSIGRGLRIEPIAGQRKRLESLYSENQVGKDFFEKFKENVAPLESLFVFGTNRNAIKTVIEEMDNQKEKKETIGGLFKLNEERVSNKKLLIPKYKEVEEGENEEAKEIPDFEISWEDFNLVSNFVENFDDRVIIFKYEDQFRNNPVKKIKLLKKSIKNKEDFYSFEGDSYKNLDLLMKAILSHFDLKRKELDNLVELGDEIEHYKKISVSIDILNDFKEKARKVSDYPEEIKQLEENYGDIPSAKYEERMSQISEQEDFSLEGQKVEIKNLATHYYNPVITSQNEKVDYINHIIDVESEVIFLEDLEEYLNQNETVFDKFDWWLFSKIDENVDDIFVPYYKDNKIRSFFPDFIFWCKRKSDYLILFVDPKGTSHTGFLHKIDGFKKIFMNLNANKPKTFELEGYKVKVGLKIKPKKDKTDLPEKYRDYAFNNITNMFEGYEI